MSAGSAVKASFTARSDARRVEHDAAVRAARRPPHVGPVVGGREHVRPDVLGVHALREGQELGQAADRDVRGHRRLQRVDERRQVADDRAGVHLLAQRQEHALLAEPAVEVAARRSVAGPGVDERVRAAHVLRAGRDVDAPEAAVRGRVLALGDRDLDVDLDSAQGVDDAPEAPEVDHHVVADVQAVQPAEHRLQRAEAAGRGRLAGPQVGPVPVLGEPAVDLAGVRAAPDGARVGRHGHVRHVPRELEHRDLLGHGIDGHDDHGVGVEARVARALVVADEQDVEPLLAVPGRQRGRHRADRAARDGARLRCDVRRRRALRRPARTGPRTRPGAGLSSGAAQEGSPPSEKTQPTRSRAITL